MNHEDSLNDSLTLLKQLSHLCFPPTGAIKISVKLFSFLLPVSGLLKPEENFRALLPFKVLETECLTLCGKDGFVIASYDGYNPLLHNNAPKVWQEKMTVEIIIRMTIPGCLAGSVARVCNSWSQGCEFEPPRWVQRILKISKRKNPTFSGMLALR